MFRNFCPRWYICSISHLGFSTLPSFVLSFHWFILSGWRSSSNFCFHSFLSLPLHLLDPTLVYNTFLGVHLIICAVINSIIFESLYNTFFLIFYLVFWSRFLLFSSLYKCFLELISSISVAKTVLFFTSVCYH